MIGDLAAFLKACCCDRCRVPQSPPLAAPTTAGGGRPCPHCPAQSATPAADAPQQSHTRRQQHHLSARLPTSHASSRIIHAHMYHPGAGSPYRTPCTAWRCIHGMPTHPRVKDTKLGATGGDACAFPRSAAAATTSRCGWPGHLAWPQGHTRRRAPPEMHTTHDMTNTQRTNQASHRQQVLPQVILANGKQRPPHCKVMDSTRRPASPVRSRAGCATLRATHTCTLAAHLTNSVCIEPPSPPTVCVHSQGS